MLKNGQNDDDHGRLLARIVRTLLASEHFDSLADLTEALKCRLAQLGIAWTNDDISTAFRVVASNTPLTRVRPRMAHRERVLEHHIDHAEAAAILHRLGIYL
jgi:hypothetical protein